MVAVADEKDLFGSDAELADDAAWRNMIPTYKKWDRSARYVLSK